ncbi:hypothetical protein DPX16_6929 [Anabarilius grahami]|uniref:Uncharacterized protein n=1 Tax=Anabarilius grahami TaxID=495550 RepID=A0A3N0Y613_ANAGA|nr:hypothetical protein DPX16_6929 [Anabarilius grahami]
MTASSSTPPPLVPFSPLAPPLTPLCCMDLPLVFLSPAPPWQEDPLAPPPATKPVTPPRLVDHSTGSIVPPALPWLDVALSAPRTSWPLAAFHPSTHLALSGSALVLIPTHSSGTQSPSSDTRRLCLGLQIHQCRPISSALRLHLGLHLHTLRLHPLSTAA